MISFGMLDSGMLDFGKHAVFIWAAYGMSALVLGGLVVHTIRRGRND